MGDIGGDLRSAVRAAPEHQDAHVGERDEIEPCIFAVAAEARGRVAQVRRHHDGDLQHPAAVGQIEMHWARGDEPVLPFADPLPAEADQNVRVGWNLHEAADRPCDLAAGWLPVLLLAEGLRHDARASRAQRALHRVASAAVGRRLGSGALCPVQSAAWVARALYPQLRRTLPATPRATPAMKSSTPTHP